MDIIKEPYRIIDQKQTWDGRVPPKKTGSRLVWFMGFG